MTSSWFFLSTLNYDARSTTHQMKRNVSSRNLLTYCNFYIFKLLHVQISVSSTLISLLLFDSFVVWGIQWCLVSTLGYVMSDSDKYDISLNLSLVIDYKWAKIWNLFADILFATMNLLADRKPMPTITWRHITSNIVLMKLNLPVISLKFKIEH